MSSHITLNDILRERDFLSSCDFLVQIPIPVQVRGLIGQATKLLGTRALSILCSNVSIPTKATSPIEVPLFGHTYKYRGRREATEPVSITWFETREMPIYTTLDIWSEYVCNTFTGDSAVSKNGDRLGQNGYTSDITIYPLDTRGFRSSKFVVYNAWVQSIDSLEFSGEASSPLEVTASLECDYFRKEQLTLADRALELALNRLRNNSIFDRVNEVLF